MDRRTFVRTAGLLATAATGAAALPAEAAAAVSPAAAAPAAPAATRPAPSFPVIKQVRAGELDVGYAELGPVHGAPVVLLHGWPYDIHSYAEVAPLLAARGYRVIVPYLRGHGSTTFLSPDTFRNAQQVVVARDVVALLDALRIERAVLAGYDWGSRTADIVAALWPERVKALVSVTGYLITNRAANQAPIDPGREWAWWYQYYFATERGRLGLQDEHYRKELARVVWTFSSPTWRFDDATFDRTAAAFTNPDYAAIVLHNYRWRLGLADGDPRFDDVEARLAAGPRIAVPTVTIDGERDPFTPPGEGAGYRDMFTGPYDHRTFRGVGHNVPQEAPAAFARAVVDADRL
ncbi:alpha/beta hydrolase [Promicromonospora sukumoe]|uniref:Pimeloyl-ACP methyl ester carboxylesterase n=1 Tax=Promicromonospora sukumoe TaxID=88382 RepID=A0A7W3PF34_9MICO|nr:alpha/beta hydrolase [Promicromonospora sukumoe]MBA8809381.1 pimeloyl-ACP methyl ester carboxylesterase [Promicromonospora sukumoe]